MNPTAELQRVFHNDHGHPTRGVVGLVDDLLAFCPDQGLRVRWQAGRGCLCFLQDGSEEVVDLPLRKSVFRAILARVAALCNERHPHSVSPFGGRGELRVGTNSDVVCSVRFANTSDEQSLELIPLLKPR